MRATRPMLLFPLLGLCLASALPLRAQEGHLCPDKRASSVPAASTDLLPWRTCFMQIQIFGIVIEIPWSRCPTGRVFIQAHTECLGQFGLGTLCEPAGSVPVWSQLCQCVQYPSHSLSVSRCECRDVGAMGFVTTGQTQACQ